MVADKRKTGIDIIGDVPWGTHFCQFYQTKEDLIDILVPYFKAGLENNEFCMWVTSEPLNKKEAEEVMRKAVPNFDQYLERGQIEIIHITSGISRMVLSICKEFSMLGLINSIKPWLAAMMA